MGRRRHVRKQKDCKAEYELMTAQEFLDESRWEWICISCGKIAVRDSGHDNRPEVCDTKEERNVRACVSQER